MCSAEHKGMDPGFPCGKCLPCRVNKRRKWVARMLLESFLHPAVWFATLTYAPEHLPPDGSVNPVHLQLFFKRLRKRLGVERIRFFAVGEYGEKGGRPHYHACIYGADLPEMPRIIDLAWGLGFTYTTKGGPASLTYVAQYTLKKLTKASDPRLAGKHPEFARMSRRPKGLGAGAAPALAEFWNTVLGREEFWEKGGVSQEFRSDGQMWPLDRYMRSEISRAATLDRHQFDRLTWAVLKLREAARRPMLTKEEKAKRKASGFMRALKIDQRRQERSKL